MRDRCMKFENAIEFLKDMTHNDLETIFGYIEQIHQKPNIRVIYYNNEHPLSLKVWKNSEVDFNKILKKYKDFEEKPSK